MGKVSEINIGTHTSTRRFGAAKCCSIFYLFLEAEEKNQVPSCRQSMPIMFSSDSGMSNNLLHLYLTLTEL
jgi:hypothetical protein